MITGFNTDVRYGDTTFHVQTEDKGVGNPIIESLVYHKGAILDSFRTSYREFLHSSSYNESTLQKILESQHRQLVIGIKKGQYKKGMELKDYVDRNFVFSFTRCRVASPPKPSTSPETVLPLTGEGAQPAAEKQSIKDTASSSCELKELVSDGESRPATPQNPAPQETLIEPSASSPSAPGLSSQQPIETGDIPFEKGIEIKVESSKDFTAGSHVDLLLFVQTCEGTRVENVQVVLKVIGTSFSPRLYAGKTDENGNLKINFNLPNYTIGSAALIIQASSVLGTDEVKYLIRRK
jgi:hypothetical protein